MYFWKCWRDSRARFICLAVLAVVAGWLCAWGGSGEMHTGAAPPLVVTKAWQHVIEYAIIAGGLLSVVVGGALGASGVGEEFERGSAMFLLTRPRSRRYFVWTSNALVAAEVLAFVFLYMLTMTATLLYYSRTIGAWLLFAAIPILFITGLLTQGVAQLLAAGSRSTRNAFAGAVLLVFGYGIFTLVMRRFWQVDLPSPSDMSSQMLLPNKEVSLALMLFGWLAVALVFPVIEQLLVERMEP